MTDQPTTLAAVYAQAHVDQDLVILLAPYSAPRLAA